MKVYNPAFDMTPPELITGIISEKGIMFAPFKKSIKKILRKKKINVGKQKVTTNTEFFPKFRTSGKEKLK